MNRLDVSTTLPVSREAVLQIIYEAGQLVVDMQERGLEQIGSKSTSIDLVTEADLASERLLRERLTALDPSIAFWGEESNEPPDADLFWLVDPIDGTVNYAAGVPWYAVNIALNSRETTLLGATLALPSRDLYWAEAGQGAFLRRADGREKKLHVNHVTELGDALLVTGFPYHSIQHPDNNLQEFTRLQVRSRGVRRLGSAALDLALVAAGAFAGYWEAWLNPWDAAPGVLLVQEAGGRVTDYRGAPWTFDGPGLVASNGQPALHQALLGHVRAARQELPRRLFDL
ncbi:MAG: inositol monophosphatase [Caldilineae bacterium]|nr:MAG: inositol monophosphatase [Caldilineae bacterium]